MTFIHWMQAIWFLGVAIWAVNNVFIWRTKRKLEKTLVAMTELLRILKQQAERDREPHD